jgi:cysteine desulfuration protein SufE
MDLNYLQDLEQEDFYDSIIELAPAGSNESIRVDSNLVHGCQSKVWLTLQEDKVVYDSDSVFVKGLITAVVSQLNTIEEMINVKTDDYSYINLETISYQRIKGIDSLITKLNELASLNTIVRG